MHIGSICSRTTYLAHPEESVRAAADRMQHENVGTLLVIDDEHRPIGILTDRDLAVRVVAPGLDVRETKVREVMSAHPRSVSEETPIEDAVAMMRRLAVRRLPVVDGDGRLAGIVSIDDVLELLTEELGNLGKILGWSQPGVVVPATRSSRRANEPVPTASAQAAPSKREH